MAGFVSTWYFCHRIIFNILGYTVQGQFVSQQCIFACQHLRTKPHKNIRKIVQLIFLSETITKQAHYSTFPQKCKVEVQTLLILCVLLVVDSNIKSFAQR